MVKLLRHRQTKGAETARFTLRPPRHIFTLPSFAYFDSLKSVIRTAALSHLLPIDIFLTAKICIRNLNFCTQHIAVVDEIDLRIPYIVPTAVVHCCRVIDKGYRVTFS